MTTTQAATLISIEVNSKQPGACPGRLMKLYDSSRTRLFQETPDSTQETMQATGPSALEPVTSDQSLAQSPVKAEMKIMQENSMASNPARDQ